MSHNGRGVAWAGLGLIGLGIAFILAQLIGWDRLWPILPLLGGLAFLLGYFVGGRQDAGLTFVGTAALLIGLFFFGFTLGTWEWDQMMQLWPMFPLIGGVAFFVLFLAEGPGRDIGLLGVALAAIIAGVVGLAITYGYATGDLVKYWPLLLVLAGLIGLVGALFRILRQK